MSSKANQPANEAQQKVGAGSGLPVSPPEIATIVEQNVAPVVTEAQRIAAETSFSGRRAVSRGTIFLAFYAWLLSGALMLSVIARYTQLFPGDVVITAALQKQRNPWVRRFMIAISEIGFPKLSVPLTIGVAGIFLALRFRLEAIFIVSEASDQTPTAHEGTCDGRACHQ